MFIKLETFDPTALPIFEECLASLQRFGETTLIDSSGKPSAKQAPDGHLTLTAPNGSTTQYACEAKRRIDVNALAMVSQRLHEWESALGMKPLLMTSHVNDLLGERLRAAGINYLDAAGNVCLVADPLVYIWLKGFKPVKQPERVARAFQATGLQLIALLLSRPNAIEWQYRELAQKAGLALGSTSRILGDLRTLGFIRLVAPGHNALVNGRNLLEHWEFGYATRLRPRLKPQAFRQADNSPVEKIPTRIPKSMRDEILIGGELAAALATRHLRPQTATLHVRPHRPLLPIIKELRLIPDRAGNIILLEQFGEMSAWRWENQEEKCLVNPLLVYAELIHGTPDDRLKETAKLIFDQYLAPIINDQATTARI